jgi:predicted enzyme related to lactoylglutathione lyase
MENVINWFEIPVTDINRAADFYSKVFSIQMHIMDFGEFIMAGFPSDGAGYPSDGKITSGALCQGKSYNPSKDGIVIYFNGGDDLVVPLSRVKAAGGKILTEKKQITPEIGYMALFIDSEGNKIALHSPH